MTERQAKTETDRDGDRDGEKEDVRREMEGRRRKTVTWRRNTGKWETVDRKMIRMRRRKASDGVIER